VPTASCVGRAGGDAAVAEAFRAPLAPAALQACLEAARQLEVGHDAALAQDPADGMNLPSAPMNRGGDGISRSGYMDVSLSHLLQPGTLHRCLLPCTTRGSAC
jgi:hypothetical protein